MADSYKVPFSAAESEFTEKRSRFIGHVWRVETEEEAKACIEQMRKKYYDARHNCFCYLLKEGNIVRYGDDGEPQGTAGQPMLHVFGMQGVTNVCCVVTRYFGGILLGAGGLCRAYAKGAADALSAAGISTMGAYSEVLTAVSYSMYERVKQLLEQYGGEITAAEFSQDVLITALLPEGIVPMCERALTELSAGSLELRVVSTLFRPGPREEAR